jgi:hypothetical protein
MVYEMVVFLAGLSLGSLSQAGYRDGWREFVVPAVPVEQTEIDLSHLNPEPAGANGFLRAQGAQIVDGKGTPLRLFGTNITDYHVMPPKDRAQGIARRLQQLGINYVRLHYFDWASAPDGILNADRQTLNAQKLDEMDYLIHQLKEHGVYTNINLHVSRGHTQLPQGWDWQGKAINRIVPEMIESQKQFARDLLTHVNPYTGNSYINEPALAIVEFNNENSLFNNGGSLAMLFAYLEPRWREPIERLWNEFLTRRYGTDAALAKAWAPSAARGPELELLVNGGFGAGMERWSLESPGSDAGGVVILESAPAVLRWTVNRSGGASWSHQLHQTDVPVEADEVYALRFRARVADVDASPAQLDVRIMQQGPPWHDVAGPSVVQLSREWKEFEVSWVTARTKAQPVRLSFNVLDRPGVYELSEISLRTGSAPVLDAEMSLAHGKVPLPSTRLSREMLRDWRAFLAERDIAYAAEMRRFLREELGARQMLLDTQVGFGGTVGALRESLHADIIDTHGYPAHPSGVRNEHGFIWSWPNASTLAPAQLINFSSMALWSHADKPYMVSEYDINAANDHAAETLPTLAILASLQDWDALAEYAWFNFQNGEPDPYNPDRIISPFATTGHAGQMATIPMSALMYRLAMVEPLGTQKTLHVDRKTLLEGDVDWSGLDRVWTGVGVGWLDAWTNRLVFRLHDQAPASVVSTGTALPAQVKVQNAGSAGATLHVDAPAVKVFIGRFTPDEPIALGEMSFTPRANGMEHYTNFSVVALDGRRIETSNRLLVTTLARVENREMTFNDTRTSVGQWFGAGPTLAEPAPYSLSLPPGRWSAWTLDGRGIKRDALPVEQNTIDLPADRFSPWVLVERRD